MSVSVEADLYDYIRDSIREWVGKNFGSQELDDPSWNINELAKYLVSQFKRKAIHLKNMCEFEIEIYLEEMSDRDRAKLVSRFWEKIERCGGSVISVSHSFENFDRPIGGHRKGIVVTVEADMPIDRCGYRGVERWLDRQKDGHGSILKYNLIDVGQCPVSISWM